jgi:enoyl-CoA hydratase/carnithine racemase
MSTTPTPPMLRTLTDSGIFTILSDNPGRLNAYTRDMWEALPKLVRAAEADPDVRVIVLRGAGTKAFSAGADISEFEGNRTGAEAHRYDEINHEAFEAIGRATKPTIAMVYGYCFGGGCELAMCCDMRWVADDAVFSIPAAKLSIGYNPRWIRPMLSVVTAAKAKEMLFTGRRYDAAAAYDMGIANAVVPSAELEAETRKVALEMALNAPLSIRAAKEAVDEFAASPESPDFARLDRFVEACFESDDYAEGRRAFMEKRKPVFRGK